MATKKTTISNVPAKTARRSTPVDRKATKAQDAARPDQMAAGTRKKIEGVKATPRAGTGAALKVKLAQEAGKPAAALKSKKELSNTFGDKIADALTAKPAAKKPTSVYTLEILRYKGFKIPVGRNSSNEMDAEIPTINVNTTAELVKLLEKLPKGCTWRTDEIDSINVYNRRGYLIVELRAPAK